MLCLVTQPNSVVLEVQLDSKSNGQECLEKVGDISADSYIAVSDISAGCRWGGDTRGWGCHRLAVTVRSQVNDCFDVGASINGRGLSSLCIVIR